MRQLIARVDDDLHARAKRRAAEIGVTLNALVVRAVERELAATDDPRAILQARAEALGLAAEPTRPPPVTGVPSRDEVIESLRGSGKAVIEALEWARGG